MGEPKLFKRCSMNFTFLDSHQLPRIDSLVIGKNSNPVMVAISPQPYQSPVGNLLPACH